MAITIDWGTKVISVPQADLTLISGSLYELDVDSFRLTLKDLEDDEDGMPFLRTHNHNTEVTLAGVTFARTVEIINGYTITFEDGQYRVRLTGANNNVSDVTNVNQVSLIVQNSAGLIVVTTGSGLDASQDTKLTAIHDEVTSIEGGFGLKQWIRLISASVINRLTGHGTGTVRARDMANTKDRIVAPYTSDGRSQPTLDPD